MTLSDSDPGSVDARVEEVEIKKMLFEHLLVLD